MKHDDTLQTSMGHFEAAMSKRKLTLTTPALATLLLPIGRSRQDDTAIALTAAIARGCGAAVRVMCAKEAHEADATVDVDATVAALRATLGDGIDIAAVSSPTTGQPHEQILAAARATSASLLVVPTVHGGDIGEHGDESLSSTVDALLAETALPLLLVRHRHDDVDDLLKEIVVAATLNAEHSIDATRWALRLVRSGGEITLLGVADQDTVVEAARLLGDQLDQGLLREEALQRAEQKNIGGLASALQLRARELKLNAVVDVRVGRPAAIIAALGDEKHCIVCLGRGPDRYAPSHHHTVDVILRAHHPVLVV